MDDLTNTTLLDRFQIIKRKGSGQIADLYQAFDKIKSIKVAVKVLHRDRAQNRNFIKYFDDEAHLQSELSHPHIVRLYDFYKTSNLVFIVMDWVEGISLREKIDQNSKPISLSEAGKILDPICKALNYAHTMKIIHCDVKPANILIDNHGKALITDFGIARYSFESNTGGTPPYMAPEQFAGKAISSRTDVYGLGITLYEMLSGGKVPYRGDTPNSMGTTLREKIFWEVMHLPLPDLRESNRQVTQSIENVVRKAIAKDPLNRFSSAILFFESYAQALNFGSTLVPDNEEDNRNQKIIRDPIIYPYYKKLPPNFQGPYLESISGSMAGYLIPFTNANFSIGRNSDRLLRLGDKTVSRMHATILWTKRGIFIRDDSSKAGTIVNGMKISKTIQLQPGDIIQIGFFDRFIFKIKY
jgi:serine/threonine protein kinase